MKGKKNIDFLISALFVVFWPLSAVRAQASCLTIYQETECIESPVKVGENHLHFNVIEGGNLNILLEDGAGRNLSIIKAARKKWIGK